MRVAYCVICHKNTKILREMVNILYHENDIYLHVDGKSNIKYFEEYRDKVIFMENRIKVSWGSYSQIEVMLKLIEKSIIRNYEYIILLSGDCLPLKTSSKIKEFLINNKGKEFIGVSKEIDQDIVNTRIKYKYNKLHYKKHKNLIELVISKLQNRFKLFLINKHFSELPKLYKGPQWFCISSQLCGYILEYLEKNPWYKEAFRNSFCGDEVFFQTIVMNSNYKSKVYNFERENDDNRMALRYIDWNTGPDYPKLLSKDDFEKIKQTNCIFGRKFSDDLDLEKYKNNFLL